MSDLLRDYLTIAIFGGVGVALVALLMGLGKIVRPDRPQAEKYINYESGVDPVGSMWGQTQVRYYVFALLFVVFDVEAVFIFPFAVRAEAYGWYGVGMMALFIVILALSILEAWKKKLLRWF